MLEQPPVIPWKEVTPLEPVGAELDQVLASVETLRGAWEDFISKVSEEEFAEARRRSLRRHAIETGIIERLYDVSWGVTEALVAEGLTVEVAEREGGIDEEALETIRTQFDALEFLAEEARREGELTLFFIRQLHELITRHQTTYEATDALERKLDAPLHHGQWKQEPNHVIRSDGSLLQYTPPEHVQSELEHLLSLYHEMSAEHPLVRAAWLHHRFICIHPFEDGNGRVARALVLLVLLKENYAPLVVDRNRREEYIAALDAANDNDLRPLIHHFAKLEIVALRSELEVPASAAQVGQTPYQVAQALAARLQGMKVATDEARAAAVATIASDVQDRVNAQLETQAEELVQAFGGIDPESWMRVDAIAPPSEEAMYWRIQLINAAKAANFFTNLNDGCWWVRLRGRVLGQDFRYAVATQKVGHGETGVLAVTVFAELVPAREGPDEERGLPIPLFTPTSGDSVTLTQQDSADDRWAEICDLIERTLAASIAELGRTLM